MEDSHAHCPGRPVSAVTSRREPGQKCAQRLMVERDGTVVYILLIFFYIFLSLQ